jgi:hypothetical protein
MSDIHMYIRVTNSFQKLFLLHINQSCRGKRICTYIRRPRRTNYEVGFWEATKSFSRRSGTTAIPRTTFPRTTFPQNPPKWRFPKQRFLERHFRPNRNLTLPKGRSGKHHPGKRHLGGFWGKVVRGTDIVPVFCLPKVLKNRQQIVPGIPISICVSLSSTQGKNGEQCLIENSFAEVEVLALSAFNSNLIFKIEIYRNSNLIKNWDWQTPHTHISCSNSIATTYIHR